ncbi:MULTISPECIES: hypothetical protein [unclassified Rhodococcus (in: high G+C Gram-positive bacteria)]|uniref:hypothetical protein n=1 Tax=unclassified Rhodococcus (in: high G+C Gram-positive bacteria) TaxID=192944 RepID=UPI001EF9F3C5|nr:MULTISPECIES: hypothetical protein [unclassified Rhodococcus (in: high G+C Gram-positive bacteria)]
MTDPDNSPSADTRPSPARPAVTIRPLHQHSPHRTPKVSMAAWAGSVVVLLAIAAIMIVNLTEIRSALEASIARDNPDYSATDISDAVTVVLICSGAAAVLLLLFTLLTVQLLSARKSSARIVGAVVGVLGIAAGLGFRSLVSGADQVSAVLDWGPLLYCTVVAVAAITGVRR